MASARRAPWTSAADSRSSPARSRPAGWSTSTPASTSQKPAAVLARSTTHYRNHNANIPPRRLPAREEADAAFEGAPRRSRIAASSNWPAAATSSRATSPRDQPRRVLLGRASDAPGDAVLITQMEHHSTSSALTPGPDRRHRRDAALPERLRRGHALARRSSTRSSLAATSASSRSPMSPYVLARSTRRGRSSAAPTRPARWSSSTAPRPSRRCPSTDRDRPPTSTAGPPRPLHPPASASLHARAELLESIPPSSPRRRP